MLFFTYTKLNRRGKKEPSERYYHRLKGTVGVISSDPPFVECRVQFTLVPFRLINGVELFFSIIKCFSLQANIYRTNINI